MYDDPTLPLDDRRHEQRPPGDLALARDSWGGFKLLARVGHGGFGEVYRAWDPNLEREVALKLLLPGPAGTDQSEDEYRDMLREARALAAIQHPNIVHVYGIDRHDGRVGFWTDFVKGKTLSVLLGSQGQFGYREATLIALDLTRALSAVHRAGMLHRDIKAENVMREEGGRILLMDFGLSTLSQRQTNTAGTPNYMAPELWQGEPATVQTDIYAMGVLLYYMVAGEPPVRLGGLSAQAATVALTHRKPLLDLRSDLPEPFLRTVATAMEADPAKRYASAGQLASALSECLGTTARIEPPPATPAWRKNVALTIPAAALVLAVVVWQAQPVRHLLHLEAGAAASGVSSTTYDQYLKAESLLQHSYKDANIAEAIQGFQQVLKEDPKFALAKAGLGAAYFAQYNISNDPKSLDLAKQETSQALQLNSNLAPAYVTQARIQTVAGQTDLAMQLAQKAIGIDPNSAEAQSAIAEVYEAQGKLDDAIAAFQKASDLEPENSSWPVQIGAEYLSKGDTKQAAAAWQHATEIDPQNVSALFDLGVVQMRSNNLEDARSSFEKVLKIQPDGDSYKALGEVFSMETKYNDAAEMDKLAIGLNARDRQAWGNLASNQLFAGDREKSMESYHKAISLAEEQRKATPDSPELLIDLADYYASTNDAARSIPLIRKALALSPTDPKIAYFAGESYEILGQRSKAIPLISKSLAQNFHVSLFEKSTEMASLRSDPAFQDALSKAKAQAAVDTTK